MAKSLDIKQHDLQPWFYFEASDNTGNIVDLSGATFAVTLRNKETGELKINRRTNGVFFSDTVHGDNIALGKGHFEWQTGETDIPGVYHIEIEVSPLAGGKFTLWSDKSGKPYEVRVIASADNV